MRRAPAPIPPPAERLAFLEGVRGLLALYVATGHVFTMVDPSAVTGRPSVAPMWLQALAAPFLYGHVAVALFIVISGFSLQLGLLQGGGSGEVRTLGGFFRRRAGRILPAYYASLLVSIVIAINVTTRFPYPPFTTYLPVDAGAVASHVLLVQNLWPDWMYKLNGVLWTIAIEAQLYLLFPGLARLQAARGRGVLLLTGLLFWLVLHVALGFFFSPVYLRLWYAFLFTIGMAAAHLAYRPPLRGRHVEACVGAIGWLGLAGGLAAVVLTRSHPLLDVPLGIALACLCHLGTVGGGGFAIRLLGARPLAVLGGFSYSLYLVHHPVEQVVYALRPPALAELGPTLAWLALVGLPAMLGVAWLFSLGFERPYLRRRRPSVRRAFRAVPTSLPLPARPLPRGEAISSQRGSAR